jgi:hypothetical protein
MPPSTSRLPAAPPLPAAVHDSDKKLNHWRLDSAALLMVSTRPKVRETTIVGNVRLIQLSSTPGDLPLLITGEMLQLRTTLDRSAVDVNGAPARVHARHAAGRLQLALSQRENRLGPKGPVAVAGPGRQGRAGCSPAANPGLIN